MRRYLLAVAAALAVFSVLLGGVAFAQPSPEYKLGFKLLADAIPGVVGRPLENEHHGANGDSLQRTTGGLMVWRKADNHTAFTNGYRTWVNGPSGIQTRLNTERFEWERTAGVEPADSDTAANMVVSTPASGAQVTSPVRITGRARVFEATVQVAIRNERGEVIGRNFTTASAGGPAWGDFSIALPYETSDMRQTGTIEVYSTSPVDGRVENLVTVQVTLLPQ